MKFSEAFPRVKARFILDCGDAGTEAIAAMETGPYILTQLRQARNPRQTGLESPSSVQYKAELLDGPYEALDLLNLREIQKAHAETMAN